AGNNALASAVQTGQVAAVAFERTFVWNRRLPRIGGVSDDSRIEPLFSRIASPIVRRPVEIRCWSEADWSKVLAEFRAWLPGGFDPSGFVDNTITGDRANLDPWVCEQLDLLAYGRDYPKGGRDQLDIASGVQLLSHEIQHLVAYGTE